jgi:hypothetical protein
MKMPSLRKYIGFMLALFNFSFLFYVFANTFLELLQAQVGRVPPWWPGGSLTATILQFSSGSVGSTALLVTAYYLATEKEGQPAIRIIGFLCSVAGYLCVTLWTMSTFSGAVVIG